MSPFDLLVRRPSLDESTALDAMDLRYRRAVECGLRALEEGDVVDRDVESLLRAVVLLLEGSASPDDQDLSCSVQSMLVHVGRREHVLRELASAGFHRIGRIDDAGRRSLWLREERDAVELRAGREGFDASVRVTREHPLFREILDVLSCARFASEWEDPRGGALEPSYALDRHPSSIHRQRDSSVDEESYLDDARVGVIYEMLSRGQSYVGEGGDSYIVDRDELAALLREVVDGRRAHRREEAGAQLEAHRDALRVWDILGVDLDERWHRFAMLASALVRSGDRRAPAVSAIIVRAVRLLRGDAGIEWRGSDRETLLGLVEDPSKIPDSSASRRVVCAVLGDLAGLVEDDLLRRSHARPRLGQTCEVQPTPEACARIHGESCRLCGFTAEVKAQLRDSDLSDASKIMRELARELGIEGADGVSLTFLGGMLLTEVRRRVGHLRNPTG